MTDKVALVTGASRGIGRGVAVELAKCGYHVVVNYAGNDAAADETLNLIKEAGGSAEKAKFDVSDNAQVAENVGKILENHGRIDVLVNNAGITRDGLFMRMSEENWVNVINTNLNSVYNVSNPVAKAMIKQRNGVIINMASIVGVYGNAGQANYAAAKAGIIGFTKSLAKELGSRNIRVNAIAPGFIETDMTKGLEEGKIVEHIPLKRLGQAEDIAKLVKFLVVDGTYVTGQVIGVDGGLSI